MVRTRVGYARFFIGTLFLVWGFAGLISLDAWAAPPLSNPHAEFDAKEHCNDCHVLFEGVPNTKCLNCHTDIKIRLEQRKGFHDRVAQQVPCKSCHREHLGRDHDLLGLNEKTFDHNLTGWPKVDMPMLAVANVIGTLVPKAIVLVTLVPIKPAHRVMGNIMAMQRKHR